MMDMLLFTLPDGSPILINEGGLCIEPEKDTNRCIITLPHNHRHGKPTLTVRESFQNVIDLIFPLPPTPVPYPTPEAGPPTHRWTESITLPATADMAMSDEDIALGEQKDGPGTPDFKAAQPKPASKAKGKKVGA